MEKDDLAVAGLTILAAPVIVILATLIIIPFGLWWSFVAWKLYGWFVIPLGAPAISYLSFYGLSLFFNLIKPSEKNEENDPKKSIIKSFASAVVYGIALLVGYIVFLNI